MSSACSLTTGGLRTAGSELAWLCPLRKALLSVHASKTCTGSGKEAEQQLGKAASGAVNP